MNPAAGTLVSLPAFPHFLMERSWSHITIMVQERTLGLAGCVDPWFTLFLFYGKPKGLIQLSVKKSLYFVFKGLKV